MLESETGDKTAVEKLADKHYQKLKGADTGPLAIDRVTLDGPRDLIGDMQA